MPNHPILLGVIGRAHGVRGLVRVTSHTADPATLPAYGPLSDPSGRLFTLRWMGEGIAEISRIVDGKAVPVTDRRMAEQLTNTQLFVERDRLPAPEDDEYYLADLIGLTAVGPDAVPIGIVSAVHDYGAGASLEITRENADSLLIPFTAASVPEVDIAAGRVIVVPPDEAEVPETVDADARTGPPASAHHDPAPERLNAPAPVHHVATPAGHDLISAYRDPTPGDPTPTRPDLAPKSHGSEPTKSHGSEPTCHGPARPGHRHQQSAAIDPPARTRTDASSPGSDRHAPEPRAHAVSDADGTRPFRAEAAA